MTLQVFNMVSLLNQTVPHICRKANFHEGIFRRYTGIKRLLEVAGPASVELRFCHGFSSLCAKEQECKSFQSSRTMRETFKEVTIPINSDPTVRRKYKPHERSAIWASVFKDMSIFAKSICYSHNQCPCVESPRVPMHIYPKNLEKLELGNISGWYDLKLTGMVTWTGQELMETTLELYQDKRGYRQRCLNARMLLEARDPSTGQPVMVNNIIPDGKEEKKLFQQTQWLRKKCQKRSSLGRVSCKSYSSLSSLYLTQYTSPLQDRQYRIGNPQVPRRRYPLEAHDINGGPVVSILDKVNTKFTTISKIMERSTNAQESSFFDNIPGGFQMEKAVGFVDNIPGGFQMEKAVEIALETSKQFTGHGEDWMMVYIDYMDIHRPISVRSIWKLTSQVVYTRKQYFQVAVMVEELDKCNENYEPVSNFLFTFKSSLQKLPEIYPRRITMEMRHLDYRVQE